MPVTVLTVLAFLLLLLLAFLGLGQGSASGPPTSPPSKSAPLPLPRATLAQTIFHVDGRGLDPRKPIVLREGQTLEFPHGTGSIRVNRLECAKDVHSIPLRGGTDWRVPDLPTGDYLLSAVVLGGNFDYTVRVRSHAAPCPGG